MLKSPRTLALMFVASITAPTLASANSDLVASVPTEGATVVKPQKISLTFDAPILAPTAGAEIVMTSMPGMTDHPPMVVKAFTIQTSEDDRTLTLLLKRPLVAGTYQVRWSAAGADKQPVRGAISFTVR